jgi:hypothetical protein
MNICTLILMRCVDCFLMGYCITNGIDNDARHTISMDEDEMEIEDPFAMNSKTMSMEVEPHPANRAYAVSNTKVSSDSGSANSLLQHAYRANKTKVRYLIMLHGLQDTTEKYTIPSVLPYQFKIEEYAESGFLIEGRWSSIGNICDENAVPKSVYRSGDTIDNRYFNGGIVQGIILGLYVFVDKPPDKRGDSDMVVEHPLFENCTRDKYHFHIKHIAEKKQYSLDQLLNTIYRYHVKNTENGKLPVTPTINVSIYSCRPLHGKEGAHFHGMHSLQQGIDEEDLAHALFDKLKLSRSKGLTQTLHEMEIAQSRSRTRTPPSAMSVSPPATNPYANMNTNANVASIPSLPSYQSPVFTRHRSRSRTRSSSKHSRRRSRSRSRSHGHTRKRRRSSTRSRSRTRSSRRTRTHKRRKYE